MNNKIYKLFVLCIFIIFIGVNSTKAMAFSSINSPVNKDSKVVYLTFDDGPSPVVTDKILDVLKEYNVKATFFVVGKEIPNREKILKRIHQEGHSIGLHSYYHNIKTLYKSDENFIDEMLMTRDKINQIIGLSPNIIRFPGGSSCRLTNKMLQELHKNNLKIYDWNVNLEDGINPTLPVNTFINNAKKYKDSYTRLIVLLHCNYNNTNTVKALPGIIEYYKSLGYEFHIINDATKEYYYRIKK